MELHHKVQMARICDKLTPEQLDDFESQFDNLEVLLEKVNNERDVLGEHVPGLDQLIHLIINDFNEDISMAQSRFQVALVLRNFFTSIFWFGYEAGKVQWPLKAIPCEEAHT